MTPLPDGTAMVSVPGVPLPPGWSQSGTTVRFIVPVGYPMAKPDCFWADPGLRLANGGQPASSGVNTLPHGQGNGLWFSWHVGVWKATDTLLTYVRVVQNRLSQPR